MKNLILLLAILNLSIIEVFAQGNVTNTTTNEEKYWVWRDRLINDFMIPGNCTGCGIVFNSRGYFDGNILDGHEVHGGFDISDEGFQMGKYLAVLASEWKVLHNGGYSTEKTEIELFWELKTIDRLDESAEVYWAESWGNADYDISNNTPNGFMIRDDVFEDFISSVPSNTLGYEHFNYLNQSGNAGKYSELSILPKDQYGNYMTLTWVNDQMIAHVSEWNNGGFSGASANIRKSVNYDNVTGPAEYSIDNYIGLLQGLVTIVSLLPDNNSVIVNNPENCNEQMNIREHAQEIIDRIINFIKNSKDDYWANNSGSDYYHASNETFPCWAIFNPITGMCVKGVFWLDYEHPEKGYFYNYDHHWPLSMDDCCNSGGAEAGVFSHDLKKIHDYYSGTTDNLNTCAYFRAIPFNDITKNPMNLWAIISVLSNWWHENTNQQVTEWVNNASNPDDKDKYIYLDLLFLVLHNQDGNPERVGSNGGFSWYNWWLSNYHCTTNTSCPHDLHYKDNYLTQMLVFNLLKVLQNQTYSFSQNTTDTHSNYPYNDFSEGGILGTIVGTNDAQYFTYGGQQVLYPYRPQNLYVNQTLISNAHIGKLTYGDGSDENWNMNWKGHVEYTAGEKIILGNGFKVTDGAYFKASINTNCQCKVRDNNYDLFIPCTSGSTKSFIIDTNLVDKLTTSSISDNEIIVFPNPTVGLFTIHCSNSNTTFYAEVFDILGKSILSGNSTDGNLQFNLSNEPKGIYSINLKDSQDNYYFGKIIHQ